MRQGVIIRTVINNMTFDGSTKDSIQQAVRDALIAFMAATAQAQAEATKEAQKAGIAHAKKDKESGKYLGRKPSYDRKKLDTVRDMLSMGAGTSMIAKATGLTRQTVIRIGKDPAKADLTLKQWEPEKASGGKEQVWPWGIVQDDLPSQTHFHMRIA